MKNKKGITLPTQDKTPVRRLSIGLLCIMLNSEYSIGMWHGVHDAACKHGVNLLYFAGAELGTVQEVGLDKAQSQIVFDLVNPDMLDGLIIWGDQLSHRMGERVVKPFVERYPSIPLIEIGPQLAGIHTLALDMYQEAYTAMLHQIEIDGHRRIALIGVGAEDPHSMAYMDVLAAHNLELDPRLIVTRQEILERQQQTGTMEYWGWGVDILMDERGLRPGVDFDAVFAEAKAAMETLHAMQARGLSVPDDVAVMAWNNISALEYTIPPISTTSTSFYEMGRQAVDTLLSLIAGESIAEHTNLSSQVVARQSCGCRSVEEAQAVVGAVPRKEQALHTGLQSERDCILNEIATQLGVSPESQPVTWAGQLLDVLITTLQQANDEDAVENGPFLPTLRNLLRQTVATEDRPEMWHTVISTLRRHTLAYSPGLASHWIEDLWQQARVMIGEMATIAQAHQLLRAEQRTQALREIGGELLTTFDTDSLMDILAAKLPRLDIPSAYLALYEDSQNPTGWAQLVLAYDTLTEQHPLKKAQRFRTLDLLPKGRLPRDRQFSFVIEPLFFKAHQIGFVILEAGTDLGAVYETLRGQISSALQGALLVQQVRARVAQLNAAAEVSSFTSCVLNPNDLIQQTVELVRERFNLYYVGLFMVDADGRWAELCAGTGDAGQQMIANGHRLKISANSMIGWCIANRQSRIALDAGQDGVRFSNPLLPETRSELALPLTSRGQAIGALTIQSNRHNAFSREDVTVLQTMADQLANAIENARLFEQTQQRAIELNKAKEAAEIAQKMAEASKEAAERAREDSEAANHMLALQIWQTNGQALLNERMRGEQDIPMLARNVIRQLCKYIGAQMGAIYILQDDCLQLVGTYAGRKKHQKQYTLGEGLVGEAALGKETIVSFVPDEYINPAPSTINEISPRYFIIAPLTYNDQVTGVVEIGSLREFTPTQTEFLNKAIESVVIAFLTAQARARVNELYTQTRRQAQELQAQEEELRATNEELEAQTESLRASETRLKQNQSALESANAELEEKAHILQEQQAKVDQQNHELERKAEELALVSKYKSEFLANMSHELRTPLNSMLILAGMLAKNESGHLSPDEVKSAQVIYSGGNDLLKLINEILDLAKVEAGKMEFQFAPMEWDYLIEHMCAQFDPVSRRKELQFNVTVAKDVPAQIVTDGQRLAQIVKNLLSNSFKFTEKGSISLTIQRAATGSGFDPAQFVAISVTDTGIGMTPKQQKVVFEAFTQANGSTSRQYGGTGLGLTITREMTHRLGGQVTLQSEPGKGSTFTIYLPIQEVGQRQPVTGDQGAANRQVNKSASHQFPITQPPTNEVHHHPVVQSSIPDDRDTITPSDRILLIVEDDASFAEIVLEYAHKKGFKAIAASDGESAIQLLQMYPPHGVMLDLRLPKVSGWEVLDQIKNNPDTRHIPIHIISVENEDVTAFQRGAIGFLTKPVSPEGLDIAFQHIEQFITSRIKSLLLVEDNDALRTSVRKLLEGNDIVISEAATGNTALEKLASQHFDCMILDLSLPDMTGVELLNRIHDEESIPKCPVIIYTGKELTPGENQDLLKYADSIIIKSVRSSERLLDETALFLHRVIADLPKDKQHTIRRLHDPEAVLEGKQVLLVDDDARNAFALSKLLGDKSMKIHIASNGIKALDALEKLPKVSIVLTDIMMPEMDGYELIKNIRKQAQFKDLPIIALTAKAMKGDREKCIRAGANDYLSKPIDPDRLFSMLRVWLSQE